jgi:hypothetical protein
VCVYVCMVNVDQFYDSTNSELMYSRQLIILLYEIPQIYLTKSRDGIVKNSNLLYLK